MPSRPLLTGCLLLLSVVGVLGAAVHAGAKGAIGPDIAVSGIAGNAWDPNGTSETTFWGIAEGKAAYSFATTSCNIGDMRADWYQSPDPAHPVIAQNLYRLRDGRFEQIGLSWVKHGFCAVNETTCGDCEDSSCDTLGIGCADTYISLLNGGETTLGPRSLINPSLGTNPGGFHTPDGDPAILGRVQVALDDVDPPSNVGALYFIEAQYVAADDTAWGNGLNSVSWRQLEFPAIEAEPVAIGDAQMFQPALQAWQLHQPGVEIVAIDTPEVDAAEGGAAIGRFNVGYVATDNGDGTWHYEYAVHNQTSDRSAESFTVTIPDCGVVITNLEFHDVDYHSGEPIDGSAWTTDLTSGAVSWSTTPFADDDFANALRWGTTYNFRFDADRPPAETTIKLGLFKPGDVGDAAAVIATALGPSAALCPADCGQLPGCGDGSVDVVDLLAMLGQWGTPGTCDISADGTIDVVDLLAMLGAFGACD